MFPTFMWLLPMCPQIITAVVAKGHRPGYLPGEVEALPQSLVRMAENCWTQEPEVLQLQIQEGANHRADYVVA